MAMEAGEALELRLKQAEEELFAAIDAGDLQKAQAKKAEIEKLKKQRENLNNDALDEYVSKLSLNAGTGSSVQQLRNDPFTTPQGARGPVSMASYLRTLTSAPAVSQLMTLKAAVIPTRKGESVGVRRLQPAQWIAWTADDFLQFAVGRNMMMMYYSPDGTSWGHADHRAGFRSFLVNAVEGKVQEGSKSSKSDVTAHLWLWPNFQSPPSTPKEKTRAAGDCSPNEVLQLMSGDPTPSAGSFQEEKAKALPPSQTIKQIGDAFPFLGRERTVETVKGIVADLSARFRSRNAEDVDVKKLSRVLICYAAYGAGKSRFGREVPVALCKLLENASGGTALDSELLIALKHPFHVSLDIGVKSHVKNHLLRRLLSLVFSKGQRYAAFVRRFPSIDEFMRACEAHGEWDATDVAKLLQPDTGFRVCFVHMDEAQELSADEMRAVTRMLTAVWATTHRTLFVPLFTGTNPTRLTNSSGAREEVVRLEPLSADTLWSIMQAVCGFDTSTQVGRNLRLFLDAISYCPRLLQLALLVMSSFPDHNPRADFLSSTCSLENVRRFLADKALDSAAWSQLFKQMSRGLVQVGVKTAEDLEVVLDNASRDALLGHVLAELQVKLHDRIGAVAVSKLVEKGLVFLEVADDGFFYLRIPFLYVWHLYQSGRTPPALHRCSLLTTPSVDKMEPGANEQQDLAFLCFRLWVSQFLDEGQRTLDFVLGQNGGGLDNVVVESKEARLDMCPRPNGTTPLTSDDCSAIVTAFAQREPVAILATPGNSGPDSALCVWIQPKSGEELPAFWGGRADTDTAPDAVWTTLSKVKAQRNAYGLISAEEKTDSSTVRAALSKSAYAKIGVAPCDNWGVGKLSAQEGHPLVIFIQSKLKRNSSNSLSANDVWVEYLKCHKIGCGRFVLLLITDGPTPAIPEALRGHVWLVTHENMLDFFGPLLGKRRQAVRS